MGRPHPHPVRGNVTAEWGAVRERELGRAHFVLGEYLLEELVGPLGPGARGAHDDTERPLRFGRDAPRSRAAGTSISNAAET